MNALDSIGHNPVALNGHNGDDISFGQGVHRFNDFVGRFGNAISQIPVIGDFYDLIKIGGTAFEKYIDLIESGKADFLISPVARQPTTPGALSPLTGRVPTIPGGVGLGAGRAGAQQFTAEPGTPQGFVATR